jgi:hypothetical protein
MTSYRGLQLALVLPIGILASGCGSDSLGAPDEAVVVEPIEVQSVEVVSITVLRARFTEEPCTTVMSSHGASGNYIGAFC